MKVCPDCEWVHRVWDHHHEMVQEHAEGKYNLTYTNFWHCVRVTIGLLLGLYAEDFDAGNDPELAWIDTGHYWTDYGYGDSWNTLYLVGWFHYSIGSDGSL